MNLNSLDPYLNLFNDLSWDISQDGNTSDIGYYDQNDQYILIQNDPRFQQFLVPLTTGPIRLYFFDEDGNEVGFQYPAGLRGIDVLGAVNTFYDQPISEEFLRELYQDPKHHALEYNDTAAEKVKNFEIPTLRDFMGNHVFFEGFGKYKDGYTVSLGS